MSISFDTFANTFEDSGIPGTTTFSHTIGSGSNIVLILLVTTANGGGGTSQTVSATFNGISMSEKTRTNSVTYGSILFYLANPDVGTHDIVVTRTTDSFFGEFSSLSYFGVKTATLGSENGGNLWDTNNITGSISVTVVNNNSWIVGGFTHQGGRTQTLTATSGTQRDQFAGSNFSGGRHIALDISGITASANGVISFSAIPSEQILGSAMSLSPDIPSVSPSVSPSASKSPSISPSVSPSASISPSISPSASPSVSPSYGFDLQAVFMAGSSTNGTVQSLNIDKDDDGMPIYYELETQELEFGNRAIVKAITDKLGIISQNAFDSKIQIKEDDKDWKTIEIALGKRINTITLPQLKGHYITLRWSGNATTKSPVLEGFYLNNINGQGIITTSI